MGYTMELTRRDFLRTTAAALAGATLGASVVNEFGPSTVVYRGTFSRPVYATSGDVIRVTLPDGSVFSPPTFLRAAIVDGVDIAEGVGPEAERAALITRPWSQVRDLRSAGSTLAARPEARS